MIIVIVNHWVKAGMRDAALRRIDANGDSSAQAPGFIFRYRLDKGDEPDRLATVSGWQSLSAYTAWKTARNAYDTAHPEPSPYERALNEVFDVAKAHPEALAGVSLR